jgi:hypothetical protein
MGHGLLGYIFDVSPRGAKCISVKSNHSIRLYHHKNLTVAVVVYEQK